MEENEPLPSSMEELIAAARQLFKLSDEKVTGVPASEKQRNIFFCFSKSGEKRFLRVSYLPDRSLSDFQAETEFIHSLAEKEAPVVDVCLSINGRYVEEVEIEDVKCFLCLFMGANGDSFAEKGYQYLPERNLTEYFLTVGRTIGKIHAHSKLFQPKQKRFSYTFLITSIEIDKMIPEEFHAEKKKIKKILKRLEKLPRNRETYGLVHFDYHDGNYMLDYSTGNLTVFDFDSCCYCFYLYDLATAYVNGTVFAMREPNIKKREALMSEFFSFVLRGYREETTLSKEQESFLPLLIQLVLVDDILRRCATFPAEKDFSEDEEFLYRMECISRELPYYGFFSKLYRSETPFCLPPYR